jgi:P27 family predicted phage terminase small subunit
MPAGRKSQPAVVLQMKGRGPGRDSGGRPIPEVPAFTRGAPGRPEWLSADARAEWDRVVPGLSALNILKPEDRAMLAAYCEAWATFKTLTLAVWEQGQTIEVTTETAGPKGITTTTKTVVNPLLSARDRVAREMRGFAANFGLSPSSEMALGKVNGDAGGDDNPFE